VVKGRPRRKIVVGADFLIGKSFEFFGPEEKVLVGVDVSWVARLRSKWYQSLSLFVYFRQRRKRKKEAL
jgi:hypothetical protein